jgi:hypothetical protein
MSRRFSWPRLLVMVVFLVLIFLGFYFDVLRVASAGGSV